MGEYKFRAWHRKLKQFSYFGLGETPSFKRKIGRDYNLRVDELQSGVVDVMQYTGLKDKNDVEIYEGDILRTVGEDHWGDDVLGVLKVVWCDEIAGYELRGLADDGREYYLNFSDLEQPDPDGEVVGNIYEDPELWEGSYTIF